MEDPIIGLNNNPRHLQNHLRHHRIDRLYHRQNHRNFNILSDRKYDVTSFTPHDIRGGRRSVIHALRHSLHQISYFFVVAIFASIIISDHVTPCQGRLEFKWVTGPWGQCEHPTCGVGGKQYREVWCTLRSGQSVMDDNCDPDFKPPGGQECAKPCSSDVHLGRNEDTMGGDYDQFSYRPESQEEIATSNGNSYLSATSDVDWLVSEWSRCRLIPGSNSCGRNSGVQYRNVTCERVKDRVRVSSSRCEGVQSIPVTSQSCELLCEQDCVVTEFSNWTDCDKTCQEPNSLMLRQVVIPPLHLGAHCPKLSKLKLCENCTRSYTYQFSNWTACTSVGGSFLKNVKFHPLIGYQTREISCLQNKGILTSLRDCSDQLPNTLQIKHRPCVMPQDCQLSTWTALRPHNSSCIGNDGQVAHGYMVRTRQVLQLPLGDGIPCPSKLVDYININKSEGSVSNLRPCRKAKWIMSAWSLCQAVPGYNNCGTGTQSRRAFCVEAGDDLVERPVDESKCPQPKPLVARICTLTCQWDCSVSQWSAWSVCNSGACDDNRQRKKRQGLGNIGHQYRLREELTLPSPGGRQCPHLTETRMCVPQSCYQWNVTLGPCETTQGGCGPGTRRQKAVCLDRVGRKVQRRHCLEHDQRQQLTWTDCHVSCPNDCVMSEWGQWSSCPDACIPQTLGRVSRSRERYIVAYHGPGRNNQRCPSRAELTETELCPLLSDCNVYRWEVSAWSGCVLTGSMVSGGTSLIDGGLGYYGGDGMSGDSRCGLGRRTRTVACYTGTNTIASDSKCESQIKPKSSEPCNVECAVDCHVTEWSEWSRCEVDCLPVAALQVYPSRLRRRFILQYPQNNGLSCPSDLVETQSCYDLPRCETHHWNTTEWSDCMLPPRVPLCGQGLRARNITCLHTKKSGTNEVPIHECLEGLGTMPAQTEPCFQPCESECELSPWASWMECGPTCEGSRFRFRKIRGKSKSYPKCRNKELYPLDQHEECLCADRKPTGIGHWSDCIIQAEDEKRFATMSFTSNRYRRNNETREKGVMAYSYCGQGKKYKAISCTKKIRDKFGGMHCNGEEYEEMNCTIPCPIDCKLSGWSAWSDCSSMCGSGIQKRERHLVQEPADRGRKCPFMDGQSKETQTRVCHEDCALKKWEAGSWGRCIPVGGMSCGPGNQSRPVSCKSRLDDGTMMTVEPGYCNQAVEPEASKSCTLPCPGQCVMSEWSTWTLCTLPCNGQQSQRRSREVLRTTSSPYQCAPEKEERLCEPLKNCMEYTWELSPWTNCIVNGGRAECGVGHKERYAICRNELGVKVDDYFCEELLGPVTEPLVVSCEIPCDNDCLMSTWSDWSMCSTTCGLGFTKRRRTVLQAPMGNGRLCPVKFDQAKPCHIQACYTWQISEWTPCMAQFGVCGAGMQERNVSCIDDDGRVVNSSKCPLDPAKLVMQTSRSCQIPCPGACKLSTWSSWSKCFISCEDRQQGFTAGVQARSRSVLAYPIGKNAPCDPNLWESRHCNTKTCTAFQWATSGWDMARSRRRIYCKRQSDGLEVVGGCDKRTRPPDRLTCVDPVCEPPAECVDTNICQCREEKFYLYQVNETAWTCIMNETLITEEEEAAAKAGNSPNFWMYGVIAVGTLFVIAVTAALYNMCELFRTGPRPRRKAMANGGSGSATGTLNSQLGMRMADHRMDLSSSNGDDANSVRSDLYKQIGNVSDPGEVHRMANHHNSNTYGPSNHHPSVTDPLLRGDPHYQNDIPRMDMAPCAAAGISSSTPPPPMSHSIASASATSTHHYLQPPTTPGGECIATTTTAATTYPAHSTAPNSISNSVSKLHTHNNKHINNPSACDCEKVHVLKVHNNRRYKRVQCFLPNRLAHCFTCGNESSVCMIEDEEDVNNKSATNQECIDNVSNRDAQAMSLTRAHAIDNMELCGGEFYTKTTCGFQRHNCMLPHSYDNTRPSDLGIQKHDFSDSDDVNCQASSDSFGPPLGAEMEQEIARISPDVAHDLALSRKNRPHQRNHSERGDRTSSIESMAVSSDLVSTRLDESSQCSLQLGDTAESFLSNSHPSSEKSTMRQQLLQQQHVQQQQQQQQDLSYQLQQLQKQNEQHDQQGLSPIYPSPKQGRSPKRRRRQQQSRETASLPARTSSANSINFGQSLDGHQSPRDRLSGHSGPPRSASATSNDYMSSNTNAKAIPNPVSSTKRTNTKSLTMPPPLSSSSTSSRPSNLESYTHSPPTSDPLHVTIPQLSPGQVDAMLYNDHPLNPSTSITKSNHKNHHHHPHRDIPLPPPPPTPPHSHTTPSLPPPPPPPPSYSHISHPHDHQNVQNRLHQSRTNTSLSPHHQTNPNYQNHNHRNTNAPQHQQQHPHHYNPHPHHSHHHQQNPQHNSSISSSPQHTGGSPLYTNMSPEEMSKSSFLPYKSTKKPHNSSNNRANSPARKSLVYPEPPPSSLPYQDLPLPPPPPPHQQLHHPPPPISSIPTSSPYPVSNSPPNTCSTSHSVVSFPDHLTSPSSGEHPRSSSPIFIEKFSEDSGSFTMPRSQTVSPGDFPSPSDIPSSKGRHSPFTKGRGYSPLRVQVSEESGHDSPTPSLCNSCRKELDKTGASLYLATPDSTSTASNLSGLETSV